MACKIDRKTRIVRGNASNGAELCELHLPIDLHRRLVAVAQAGDLLIGLTSCIQGVCQGVTAGHGAGDALTHPGNPRLGQQGVEADDSVDVGFWHTGFFADLG